MARRVTISTIGAPQLTGGHGLEPTAALARMQAYWEHQLAQVLPDRPDLIVLPEACDRFADHTLDECRAYYRGRGHAMCDFFAAVARQHRTHIAYSASRELPDATWRNSTQLIDRRGQIIGIYDKNHVMIEETTVNGVLPGNAAPVFDTDFGRVACAICFDLNFDELRLKVKAQRPDLILFSSAYHGGMMQPYWAYSCRAHFVSAVFGTHPSAILNPLGETIAHTTNYFDFVTATVNLDCVVVHLDYHWEKLAAAKRQYGPGIVIHDPGCLGSVLLTSELDDRTALDIAGEFGLELLDDYWQRALAHRHHYLPQ